MHRRDSGRDPTELRGNQLNRCLTTGPVRATPATSSLPAGYALLTEPGVENVSLRCRVHDPPGVRDPAMSPVAARERSVRRSRWSV